MAQRSDREYIVAERIVKESERGAGRHDGMTHWMNGDLPSRHVWAAVATGVNPRLGNRWLACFFHCSQRVPGHPPAQHP